MANTDLAIKIATTMDSTGIKKADKAINGLQKSTVRLGKSLGLALSVTALVAYGKASVRASANMQAQQQRLASLMKVSVGASDAQIQALNNQAEALKNVGVVTKSNITQVQSQLATFNLQASTIAKLTPSILDYVTAEKGAAATTDQFKQMTNGLAQALNGNFASLTAVGFVIDENTRSMIKSGTESERAAAIVKVLDSTYKGFNASLRDTPVGQLQLLSAAAEDAKVTIGTGLMQALGDAGGKEGLAGSLSAIAKLATIVSDLFVGIGRTVAAIRPFFDSEFSFIGAIKEYRRITEQFRRDDLKAARDKKKAIGTDAGSKIANKSALALVTATKKLTAEQKKQNALKKAGTLFDLEQVQIIAALKGKVSDEDRKRLELQLALLTGNEKEASKLTYELARAQGLSERLAGYLASLPDAKNPFASWEAYLDMLAAKARAIVVNPASPNYNSPANPNFNSSLGFNNNPSFPTTNIAPLPVSPQGTGTGQGGSVMENYRLNQITVQIDGKTVATALQDQSLSGNNTAVRRTGGW